jgi:peptide deformylase
MILPIVAYGDPILRQKAIEVNMNEAFLPALINDMFETMYNANGVGLAAPQVGYSLRVFVVDPESNQKNNESRDSQKIFINPVLIQEEGGFWEYEEGCLSIPGIRKNVSRKSVIIIQYTDFNTGERKIEKFEGLIARIIQHEYDHLEGKLFIDYLTPLQKKLLKSKLTEISKGIVQADYKMRFYLSKNRIR